MIFKSKGNSVTYRQNRDTFEYEKLLIIIPGLGFPGGSVVKNLTADSGSFRFISWVGKIPLEE